jgi:hypothetical protein
MELIILILSGKSSIDSQIIFLFFFSRRMAYSPLPLAAVIIHMTLLSFKVYGGSSSQFNYATMKILAAVFLNLFLFKV